jgi:hypothetical protein
LLLTQVRRNEQTFRAMIFFRDVREITVALVLIPVWIVMGRWAKVPWMWYAMIPALLFVAGFMLIDRRRHAPRDSEASQSLAAHVASALTQVDHQIWLLRNVFWWYLLPMLIAIVCFAGHIAWAMWQEAGWAVAGFVMAVTVPTFVYVYWLNQRAVRSELLPRREELRALLESLNELAN